MSVFGCCAPGELPETEVITSAITPLQPLFKEPAEVPEPEPAPGPEPEAPVVSEPVAPAETVASDDSTFVATIDLSAGALDGCFDSASSRHDDRFIVMSVASGGLESWNSKCAESRKVKVFDRIIAVNGEEGTAAELSEKLKQDLKKVDLTIQRAVMMEITLKKNGLPIGLNLTYVKNMKGLFVKDVHDKGIVKDWNATASPETTIKPCCRIIAVNDQKDDSYKLLETLKASEELKMVIASWPLGE
mmetsp:Transcript_76961/g.124535  ORF Transcript_76961/g.124535 Transcript_76961/m.124535 type:complete len:246 (-) Transcript_76961:422-1159(-)